MIVIPYLQPATEPVTCDELKLAMGDSGSLADNSTLYPCIPAASYNIDYELMTLDVVPATAWVAGDIITGQTSSKTCVIVTVITTKTFIVKSRSGAFTLGEIVGVTGVAAKLADQGAAFPTFSSTYNSGYMVLGTPIDVLGHTSVVYLRPINNGTGGTVDARITESDVITGPFTVWSTAAFTQVTEATDTVIQELTYTGSKKYIRVEAKPLVAACEFSTDVMVWEPVSAEDSLLEELIAAARISVENDTSKKIMQQTWDYYPQRWPSSDRIRIPFGNLVSVTYVKWKSTDGTETTLVENTDYVVVSRGDQCGFVGLPYQGSWPTGELYPHDPITIRFVCGYGLAADVPVNIKQAIKRRAINLYMNKGDDEDGRVRTPDMSYPRMINNIGRLWDMEFL